jgi:hypothetical protein
LIATRIFLSAVRISVPLFIALLACPLIASAAVTYDVVLSGSSTGTVTFASIGDAEPILWSFTNSCYTVTESTNAVSTTFNTTWASGEPVDFAGPGTIITPLTATNPTDPDAFLFFSGGTYQFNELSGTPIDSGTYSFGPALPEVGVIYEVVLSGSSTGTVGFGSVGDAEPVTWSFTNACYTVTQTTNAVSTTFNTTWASGEPVDFAGPGTIITPLTATNPTDPDAFLFFSGGTYQFNELFGTPIDSGTYSFGPALTLTLPPAVPGLSPAGAAIAVSAMIMAALRRRGRTARSGHCPISSYKRVDAGGGVEQ